MIDSWPVHLIISTLFKSLNPKVINKIKFITCVLFF